MAWLREQGTSAVERAVGTREAIEAVLEISSLAVDVELGKADVADLESVVAEHGGWSVMEGLAEAGGRSCRPPLHPRDSVDPDRSMSANALACGMAQHLLAKLRRSDQ